MSGAAPRPRRDRLRRTEALAADTLPNTCTRPGAGLIAASAVRRVRLDVGLTPGGHGVVTVAPAGVAGQHTGASRTARRGVGDLAGAVAADATGAEAGCALPRPRARRPTDLLEAAGTGVTVAIAVAVAVEGTGRGALTRRAVASPRMAEQPSMTPADPDPVAGELAVRYFDTLTDRLLADRPGPVLLTGPPDALTGRATGLRSLDGAGPIAPATVVGIGLQVDATAAARRHPTRAIK